MVFNITHHKGRKNRLVGSGEFDASRVTVWRIGDIEGCGERSDDVGDFYRGFAFPRTDLASE